jgi:glycosyltransferase involved in cell wall biosynthesis
MGESRRVLCLVPHYVPGYKAGGALRTVHGMATILESHCRFDVLTSDRDLGDQERYSGITADRWSEHASGKVYYASRHCRAVSSQLRKGLWDVLYVNSFFSPCFSLLPVALAAIDPGGPRIVVAPRGEFSPAALHLKRFKKTMALGAALASGAYRRVIWHASTGTEAADIRRVFGRSARDIRISTDVTLPPAGSLDLVQTNDLVTIRRPLRICFLGRIAPMKNLDFAIRVLSTSTVSVEFDIYGPVEDTRYAEQCWRLVDTLPANVRAEFKGPVEHKEVSRILARSHLLFLPSRGENFGHVIAESLGVGTPVLISNRTPWIDLLSRRLGWDIDLADEQGFRDAIAAAVAMPDADYRLMRVAAIESQRAGAADLKVNELLDLLFRPAHWE